MRRFVFALVGSVILMHGSPLHAQKPLSLSVAGGVSAPQGDLSDNSGIGWHALAALNVSSMMLPLGLRVDAAFNRFGSSDAAVALGSGGHYDVASLTGNFTYRLPVTNSPLAPYLIAGLGAYRTRCSLSGTSCDGSTAFGWNAGLGTRLYLLGLRTFVEARFHSTERGSSSVNYFPVTLGITF